MFYEYRSVVGNLSAGTGFLTSHFWKCMWLLLPVLLGSAVCAGMTLNLSSDMEALFNGENYFLKLWLLVAGAELFSHGVTGAIYQLMDVASREEQWWRLTWRHVYNLDWIKRCGLSILNNLMVSIVGAVLVYALILLARQFAPAVNAPGGESNIGLTIFLIFSAIVMFLVMIAVMVPASMTLPAMQLTRGNVFARFWNGYKLGWKNWGKVFALSLLVGLLLAVVLVIVASPSLIAWLTRRDAMLSMLQGDAVALPDSFGFYATIIFIVSGLFSQVAVLLAHTSLAHQFASLWQRKLSQS